MASPEPVDLRVGTAGLAPEMPADPSYDVFRDDSLEAAVAPAARAESAESATWEPRPVPPPTYSLKPAAPSIADRLDPLDEWAEEDGSDLDAILDHGYDRDLARRAVND